MHVFICTVIRDEFEQVETELSSHMLERFVISLDLKRPWKQLENLS